MSWRPLTSGMGTVILVSNLPGLTSALSEGYLKIKLQAVCVSWVNTQWEATKLLCMRPTVQCKVLAKQRCKKELVFNCASTCYIVWPGLACTCVDLRSLWSGLNLHASQRKFFFVRPPNASQRKFLFVRPPNASQRKSCCLLQILNCRVCSSNKMAFWQLACTCESVWPACDFLRPLVLPFGQS